MTYTYLLITVKFEPEAKFSADPMLAISLYGPKRKEDGKKKLKKTDKGYIEFMYI